MVFTQDNVRYRLALTKTEWIAFRNASNGEGFRTHSLTLSGSAASPRYTGVMVKSATPFRGESVLELNEADMRAEVKRLVAEGLYPYILTATGAPGAAVYAAAFRASSASEGPVVLYDMSPSTYRAQNETQSLAGRILLWVDAFGSADDIHYCALWTTNPDRVAWNADAINDLGDERQERFEAMNSVGARRSLVAMTPAGGLACMYVDSRINSSATKSSLTRAAMDAEAATQAAAGRFPVCIGATDIGTESRFTPIFASGDDILPRTWRVRGPAPITTAAERTDADKIDAAMETFLKELNVRGAALAIVEGTRLVYAKGFTFAEADYAAIEPTTLFRQASLSKLFCGLAMWRLMADDPKFSRGSTLQSVLNLKTPENQAPTDPDFPKITMRNLLESNSGIYQKSVWKAINDRRDTDGWVQPITVDQIASKIAGYDMPGTPGAPGEATYGKADYWLLSRVIARKTGFYDFEQALKQVLLDPLKMTRTRGSRSLVGEQAADEARYHLTSQESIKNGDALVVGKSVRHPDRRLLPAQYGASNYEVFDGAGGISSAVIDVARLCAMLACRLNNPVLSASMIDQLFADAVKASTERPSHGFHGFDGASYVDEATHAVAYNKGGSLAGVRTSAHGVTGGRVYVMAYNGNMAKGVHKQWKDRVASAVNDVTWGDGDLFPHYDMPSLGGVEAANRRLVAPAFPVKIGADFEEEVEFWRR